MARWHVAPVLYRNENELDDLLPFYIDHPWMLKRRSFQHEKELRVFKSLLGGNRNHSGLEVTVNPVAFINKVILSPFNAAWENDVVTVVLRKLWADRFNTELTVEASRHLAPPESEVSILKAARELQEKAEQAEMDKTFFRLPAKLMLRGRTTHSTDEVWIIHTMNQVAAVWDKLPNNLIRLVILEETREILKFTRQEKIAKEAWWRLDSIQSKISETAIAVEETNALVREAADYLRKELTASNAP